MRLTYRTARVLQALAEHPGQSNREVADRSVSETKAKPQSCSHDWHDWGCLSMANPSRASATNGR